MIIAYNESLMQLCPASQRSREAVPDGSSVADDFRLDDCFDYLTSGQGNIWVWTSRPPHSVAEYLHCRFRYVKAAGGLVCTDDGDCLMIHREGRWDLPKGMVEQGETLATAALREVAEETGVAACPSVRLVAKTYHIYDKYGGWHLKQTSWFAMRTQRIQPRPQTEEEITEAVWVPGEVCLDRLSTSYASLQILANTAKDLGFFASHPTIHQ
jgi:ADP-ribose pyrophosphatase YjhB (NUDIX family)